MVPEFLLLRTLSLALEKNYMHLLMYSNPVNSDVLLPLGETRYVLALFSILFLYFQK